MSDRRLLMDVIVVPCNCNLQIWVEDTSIHVGPCCESCERVAIESIRATYPNLPTIEVE